jgi:hypothetical protein
MSKLSFKNRIALNQKNNREAIARVIKMWVFNQKQA